MKKKMLVTGATGFVGQKLIPRLDRPYVTSRNPQRAKDAFGDSIEDAFAWPSEDTPFELPADLEVDGVINLMGESIADGRWNNQRKKRIRDSRVNGTRKLVESIAKLPNKPRVLVSTSAVGYYGSRGDEELTESSPPGNGFLPEICQEWEAAAMAAEDLGIRVVTIRVGIVLGKDGGALEKLVPLFRWGLGAKLGSGKQYMPWIHIDDLVNLYLFTLTNDVSGALNGTSPEVVTNATFTQQLARAVRRPAFMIAPKFGVRLLAGEFANSLFDSQKVLSERTIQAGFEFQYPDLESALTDLIR